jgi:hypothetical protein
VIHGNPCFVFCAKQPDVLGKKLLNFKMKEKGMNFESRYSQLHWTSEQRTLAVVAYFLMAVSSSLLHQVGFLIVNRLLRG